MFYFFKCLFFFLISAFFSVLNACTQVDQPVFNVSSYYQGFDGLSGMDLKKQLNLKISNHTAYSYSPCVWEILKQADQSPNNTAAVIGFYTRRDILKVNRDYGQNTPDNWNREHIWPKSHGFKSKRQTAYSDVHALRASDKSVNAERGNKDFADGGVAHHECTTCKTSSNTWEPTPEVKGDVARMMFYMATRYDGSDNSGVGDLTLVDSLTSIRTNKMGKLCDLMQWHINDPVSAEEQKRNDIIYSWQGNRNPFIDHPEYAIRIWGGHCNLSEPQPVTPIENKYDEDVPFPLWFYGLMAAMFFFQFSNIFRRV